MARTPFVPTRDQRMAVRVMVACGVPQSSICQAVINNQTGEPLDPKTLRRAFRDELDDAKATANGLVAQSLFKRATGTGPQSVTAAIFWLKTQAGWRETQSVELYGRNGGPIEHAHKRSAADYTDDELAAAMLNGRSAST